MTSKYVTIQDLGIEIIDGDRGKNYPHQYELFDEGYCLFLSAQNVTSNGFNFIENKFITKEKDLILRNGKLEYEDIVITTRGTVGNVGYYTKKITYKNLRINSGMLILRCNKNINSKYLYYVLSSKWFHDQILSFQTGTAQPQLPKSHFQKMKIPFLPLQTQEKVACILSSLDDKIELNNKINQNLEQQADLLFNDLFLEDKDCIKLSEVISTTSGGTPSRKNLKFYTNGSFCWVKSKELNGTFITETEEKINQLAIEKSSAKLLPPYSVLLAMYGATVGEYAIISKQMTCNQAICAIIPNEKYPYTYIYEYIKLSKEKIKTLAIGSAQQNISQVLIKDLLVHKNINKIKEYHFKTRYLFELIKNNQIENEKLKQLRDTLLPKLMSGEINVDDVEV